MNPARTTSGRRHARLGGRVVHAVTAEGRYVVRYRLAGEWYVEPAILGATSRIKITLDQAATLAAHPEADWRPGRTGGAAFDALVTSHRMHREQAAS